MTTKEKVEGQVSDLSYLSNLGALGGNDISREDIIIPYVKVIEKLSNEVSEGIAAYGDVINSVTKEKIIDDKKEMEFVVLRHFIDYRISDEGTTVDSSRDGINWKSGAHYPVDEIWKYKVFNFLIVLTKDLRTADPIFYRLWCAGGRAKAGKALVNELAMKCIDKGFPIFAKPFIFKALEVTAKNGKKYIDWQVKEGSKPFISSEEASKLTEVRKLVADSSVITTPALLEERL